MASRYACSKRPARSVGDGTRCRAVDGFAACAAHRSHQVRSGPGGKRPQIARRRLIRAACRIVFERTGAASYSALRVSLLDFNCDRPGTRRPAWRSVPSPVAAAGVRVGQRGLGAAG